jgi:hypothetical protein
MKYHAEWIDASQFAFLCYECDDYHYHGNAKDFTDRVETRHSHCLDCNQIEVIISPLTKRFLFGKDKTKYQEYLNSQTTENKAATQSL